MKTKSLKILAVLLFLACSSLLYPQNTGNSSSSIQINADSLNYAPGSDIASAKGNVDVEYGGYHLTCDEATINRKTMDYMARGNVVATIKGQGDWRGESIKGNLKNKTIFFGPFRMTADIWHAGGDGGETLSDGRKSVKHGWLTTCELEEPHYSVGASSITINPEKKTFSAWNAVIRIGSVPVFYFPYLWGTTDNSSGYIIQPGYSGKRGAYLRLGMLWEHDNNLGSGDSSVFTDLMTKRGIAIGERTRFAGEDLELRSDLYAIHDQDPPKTGHHRNRRFESDKNRYRLHLYLRELFNKNWSLRLNADYLSDISMLEDWFKRDYRDQAQPKSFINLQYDNNWMNFSLNFRPRINTFYTVSERLPELKLTIPEIRVIDSLPLLYSSETSAGYYSMKWRNNDFGRKMFISDSIYDPEIHHDPHDYSSFRADTLHTIKMNLDLGEIITLTPRASLRATYYSRTSKKGVTQEQLAENFDADDDNTPHSTAAVTDYDNDGGSQTRYAAEYGLEGRSKIYSDWSDISWKWLPEANSIRHIVEPYFNYTYAPTPSLSRDNIYYFDEIDRLERQNFLRMGIDQRLQTRNAESGELKTLLTFQTYIDVHFDRDDASRRYWGNVGSRLEILPTDLFSIWGTFIYDIGDGATQRAEAGIRLGRKDDLQLRFRYIYRQEHLSRSVYSMGSSLADFDDENGYTKKHFRSADKLVATLNIPFNSKTSLELHAEYDFERNSLSRHHYYLTREMHCWTISGGIGWDNHDMEVMLMLRLNAFPKVKLDLNI